VTWSSILQQTPVLNSFRAGAFLCPLLANLLGRAATRIRNLVKNTVPLIPTLSNIGIPKGKLIDGKVR